MCKVSARCYSLLMGIAFTLGIPGAALAQSSLTWAKVEKLRNRVHLVPNNQRARLARIDDLMSVGDALRTAASSRAELRFNDGSLARVGEQATFRFTPNTRNFQLSNGTVLLLIPPGRGRTTIQTPNAVTGIQGSALFVRVRCLAELTAEGYCASPITLVGALTNNSAGAMMAYNESGSQQQPIYAGEMVVIEGEEITQRHEFDLRTFYQTSGLVKGLQLDSPTPPETLSEDLQDVWQEIQDALELQGDFDDRGSAEEVVENPEFIAPVFGAFPGDEGEPDESIFAGFPSFSSSPASIFHVVGQPVVTSQPAGTHTGLLGTSTTEDGSVTPVTSARFSEFLNIDTAIQEPGSPSVASQPVEPTVAIERPAVVVPAPAVVNPTTTSPAIPPTTAPSPVVEPTTPVVVVTPPTTTAPVVITPSTATPVVVTPPTVTTPAVSEPVGEVPSVVIPAESPTPEIIPTAIPAPVVVAEPTPTVTAPSSIVTTVPEPAAAPTPVVQPEPTPVIAEQPITPIAEADQVPVRAPVPSGDFNWGEGTSNPVSNPEVILPSLDIQVPDSTENGLEPAPSELIN